METLTYKCPGCGAQVEYDVASGYLVCRNCNQYYVVSNPASSSETQKSIFDNHAHEEFMDIRVYHCSSCGAEIMTGDENISTFCSYCGQSTIMFDRISKEKRPEKIVPFVITKEDALAKAKYKFGGGKYTFNKINEVSVDSVNAIYMPYWVYDAEAEVEARVNVKNNHGRVFQYNKVKHKDINVALDASQKFNNKASLLLNPFTVSRAEDFDLRYLSGFCADRSDINEEEREEDAKEYLIDEIKEEILDDTPGVSPRSIRETFRDGIYDYRRYTDYNTVKSDFKCNKKTYMLLPVYFITFIVGDETVIILVNGQTGKVVGNVPIDQKKFKTGQFLNTLVMTVAGAAIGGMMFSFLPIWWAIGFLAIIAYSATKRGQNDRNQFISYYRSVNSVEMFNLIKDRGDK